MSELRVLVAINCRWWNASAALAVGQAAALRVAGADVLLQAASGSPAASRAGEAGVRVVELPLGERGLPPLRGLLSFRRLVRGFRPHVLCAHRGPGHLASALAGAGVPIVRVRSDIRKPGRGLASRSLDRRTDLVVLPCRFMAEERKGYVDPGGPPFAIIPPAVDTCAFLPMPGGPPGGRTLLALGRLSPMKGHGTLLRAAALLGDDVRIVIAGEDAQYGSAELLHLAGELGLAGRIELPGRVEDVRPLLASATLGVVASLGSEVYSRACLEMMASGLPVLAAATNGLIELVRDGVTGLLHPPGDFQTLARQSDWLLARPELRVLMGNSGREVCEASHSLEAVGREWMRVLRELAG
ncbi:glycosyltransferase family 4 protein [Candidatus Fermentibacterales bacterium]|nr:glycosyltransferase family 4 protein [Candidatus Fermentibacterales bacterium]